MKNKRILGIISAVLGSILIINSKTSILNVNLSPGSSESFGFILGLVLVVTGITMFFVTERNERKYDSHALERMEERNLYPMVVEDVIKHGEHYHLSNPRNFGEAKGATEAYIKRHVADIAPGGKVGERIIKAEPGKKRKFKNVLVLTNGKGQVKTAYVRNDSELDSFMEKYVSDAEEKAA